MGMFEQPLLGEAWISGSSRVFFCPDVRTYMPGSPHLSP